MKPHLPPNWTEIAGPDVGSKYTRDEIKRQEVCSIFLTLDDLNMYMYKYEKAKPSLCSDCQDLSVHLQLNPLSTDGAI